MSVCKQRDVDGALVDLFHGLYDGSSVRSIRPVASRRVFPADRRSPAPRLLNPGCADDDATARRFSLLEID
jgi:hypothetical protein